ncbi:MAG: hypothetical protein K1W24_04860 [Lachnospiraceae bacterium]
MILKKKIWNQITAIIMACTLVTSTAGSNTALAAGNKKNITATSKPVKVNGETTKENSIAENIKPEERTPELDRILNECEEIKTDGTSKGIRKGQIMSVESISSDSWCEAAITEDGDLYCWGYNGNGQVGNGTTEDQLNPIKVLSNVESVLFSNYFSVSAITENGDLYCWGYNLHGQVGNGTTEVQTKPIKVLSDVKTIFYSYGNCNSVLAIVENGDLYCWGYNFSGGVGNGTIEDQIIPVKVLSSVKTVSISSYRSFHRSSSFSVSAITENGDLYCWGGNKHGQIGNGTTKDRLTPVKILLLDNSNNDNTTKFSITSSVSGELDDTITFSGSLVLPDNKEASSDILDEEISNITWTSGDTGIAEGTKCEGTHSSDNRSATLRVSVTPHKEGSVVITGRTSDGVTASCMVTVENVKTEQSFIINAVNKYSTDNETLKKMLFYINEKDLPYDVKMQLMNDVCMRYGYTDIKEGIEYLNDANSAQIAYNALVNNEQYCCWNFGYYLNSTTKGRIAKGLLYTNGLIFNNELGAWIEPGTYIENDYPGIKKYKTLLAKFIEDRSTEFEIYTRANQVVSTIQDILKLKKLDNRLELEKKLEDLFKASSLTEQDKIIDYLFQNYELKIEDGKHVKVKSEVWGKAFGIASATLKLATDSTNDILAFFDVSTRMKLYQEYDVFFNEIIHAQDLPFELRAAAYFLQDEVKSGYFTPIKNLLLHSLKNAAKLQSSIQ